MLLAYLVAHLLIGALLPFRREYRPAFWTFVHMLAGVLGRKLNRKMRRSRELSGRGFFTLMLLALLFFFVDFFLRDAARQQSMSWLYALPLMAVTVSAMMPVKVLREISLRLEKNQEPAAAKALQPYVSEELANADAHTIARKAIEFGAVAFNRYLVAPGFYYLALGTTGLALYTVMIAAGEAWELLRSEHFSFARAARLVEKLLDFIPSIISLFLFAVAALCVSGANGFRALKTAATQARRFHALARGILVGGVAGALDVTLGGPAKYRGSGIPETQWIGPEGSSARVTINDLKRGRMLIFVSFLCVIAFLSLTIMLKIKFT